MASINSHPHFTHWMPCWGDIHYIKPAYNMLSEIRSWEGRLFLVADKHIHKGTVTVRGATVSL
jgi:flagellar biosynthesis/type III secretory pathway protein FliH